MEIINGLDGQYSIFNGKLLKVKRIIYPERYFIETGCSKTIEFELDLDEYLYEFNKPAKEIISYCKNCEQQTKNNYTCCSKCSTSGQEY